MSGMMVRIVNNKEIIEEQVNTEKELLKTIKKFIKKDFTEIFIYEWEFEEKNILFKDKKEQKEKFDLNKIDLESINLYFYF